MKIIFVACLMVVLAFLTTSDGMSLGVELQCRCIKTLSKPIGRLIEKVEIIRPNSHCELNEVVATLKRTGQEVCLDPQALWVKRIIEKILSQS